MPRLCPESLSNLPRVSWLPPLYLCLPLRALEGTLLISKLTQDSLKPTESHTKVSDCGRLFVAAAHIGPMSPRFPTSPASYVLHVS